MVFNIFRKSESSNEEPKPERPTEGLAELLQFMVEKLVDNPGDVHVKEIQGESATILEVKVNEADMGKVIGKKGRIIKSLRIVVRAAAVHEGKSVSIELVK